MARTEVIISEKKKIEVESIKRLIKEYKVLAIVNLEKLPAFNLMKMKAQLKDRMVIKYSKKRLIKIAFDQSGDKNIEGLKDKLIGIPALIFTNEDPFKLFQLLKKNKSPAPAKDGDIAPRNITIPAGPTDFPPGPMIGELGQLGIKTAVEGGKIAIKLDKLLVKEGEVINAKHAELLSKLKIEPMEIGLNLVLTYGNNEILVRSVLDIDTDVYSDNIKMAASESISLAVYLEYITDETIELLIKKSVLEANEVSSKADLTQTTEAKSENVEKPIEKQVDAKIPLENVETTQEKHIEKKTVLEREIEERAKYTEEVKKSNDVVIEQKTVGDVTKEDMKQAENYLKELVNKKIKGEI